ncbi:hypothetical protein D9M71_674590 [compost metagenome]
MGIGELGVELALQELGVRVEAGKTVVIAVVERQALARQAVEEILGAPVLRLGDEDFRILQTHVDAHAGNPLPPPVGVLEHRQVDPPFLEIPEASGNGGGPHEKAVIRLQFIERVEHLR